MNTVVVPSPTETGMPAALNVARLPLATAAPEQSADAKIRTTDVDAGTSPTRDGVVEAAGVSAIAR